MKTVFIIQILLSHDMSPPSISSEKDEFMKLNGLNSIIVNTRFAKNLFNIFNSQRIFK